MQLDAILERSERLERRAAAVYRSFAVSRRDQPLACSLWTRLARDEEEHARSIAGAQRRLPPRSVEQTRVDGWEEALAEVEDRLGIAERLGTDAGVAEQLSATLEVELSALEAVRHDVLAAARSTPANEQHDHAERLAATAELLTDDAQVRLQVALLRARARLRPS